MRNTVSVVIPTLNGGERFAEVLSGLARQRERIGELVVVDSGSTDGTVERALDAGARVVEIERGAFDHGLTRDLGIARSSGEFVVLLSQDAVPGDAEMVGGLLAGFLEEDVMGVFGKQMVRGDADVLTRRRLKGAEIASDCGWVHRIGDSAAYEKMGPIERYRFCRFDNVCSAIRRSAWERTRFGQCGFGEDIRWAKRILENGGAICYQPAAWVIHSHGASPRRVYERTLLDHRMLRKVFGLRTIPNRRRLVRAVVGGTLRDMAYVSVREPKMLAKVPGLTWASAIAQYRGGVGGGGGGGGSEG